MKTAKSVPGFKFVRSAEGISEYNFLKNGLRVLHMEDKSAPVTAINVTYHVGSRNEVLGTTGATHILEHMLFQGAKKFDKTVWHKIEDTGARLNATTWYDRTNYYELVPREYAELALSAEADRMRHAKISQKELDTEMVVVRNEYERGENDPVEALDKLVWATAFQAHPYHHSTIGWKSDIESITAEKLRKFYDTFYYPNNATVTIIGDLEKTKALLLVKKYFGTLPRSKQEIPKLDVEEPLQEGERRVIVSRAGEQSIVMIAHKIPHGRHEDIFPLEVFRSAISGGLSSRLYSALVDTGKATTVSSFLHPLHDDGLFCTFAYLTLSASREEVEAIILSEYERIKKDGITETELKKAYTHNKASIVYGRDGVLGVTLSLNEFLAAGDWTLYAKILPKLEAVTTKDVSRIVAKYFTKERQTVGHFIPKK